jgi:hypothetical protein
MFRSNNDAGNAGNGFFDDGSDDLHTARGRTQADDFGLPERNNLLGLARSYLELQGQFWPQLLGTAVVLVPTEPLLEAMADGFALANCSIRFTSGASSVRGLASNR